MYSGANRATHEPSLFHVSALRVGVTARCWRCGRFTTSANRITVEHGGVTTVSDTCPRAECHEGIAMIEAEEYLRAKAA